MTLYPVEKQLGLLENALRTFKSESNDRGVSVLTSVFYKAVFKEAAETESQENFAKLLAHARDIWLPETLNCLKDDTKYILDIVESLSTSLSLLSFLFFLERKTDLGAESVLYRQEFVDKANSEYFDSLSHTIEAGMQSLDE